MVKRTISENQIDLDEEKTNKSIQTFREKDINAAISLNDYLSRIGLVVEKYVAKSQWVMCEIVSFNEKNGIYYFELVDKNEKGQRIKSQTAVLYKDKVYSVFSKFERATSVKISNGMKVLFKITAKFSASFGLSLYIEDVNPSFTIGEMEVKANNIRAKMIELGIDLQNKTKNIPKHFTNVAVISPDGAAGLGDFKVEADLLESHNLCSFKYFTATFEGAATQESIKDAFVKVHLSGFEKYDCLVFIRGGGAKSSLQFLNEEIIVKCICRVPIPVISGIGHEKDKVLIDEYSCLSLDTPSKVIEYITNVVVKNYNDALTNINYIYNLTEQTISNYEQQSKLISQNNLNTIENNFTVFENNFKMTSENIGRKVSEIINETENVFNNNVQKNYNLVENLINEFENGFKSNYEIIDRKIVEIINGSENNLNYIVEKIKNEVDHIIVRNENILSNSVDMILSDILKITELKEQEFKSTLSEIRELDPTKILGRGYSIIKVNNNIVDSIELIGNDNEIIIIMKDGSKKFKIQKQ